MVDPLPPTIDINQLTKAPIVTVNPDGVIKYPDPLTSEPRTIGLSDIFAALPALPIPTVTIWSADHQGPIVAPVHGPDRRYCGPRITQSVPYIADPATNLIPPGAEDVYLKPTDRPVAFTLRHPSGGSLTKDNPLRPGVNWVSLTGGERNVNWRLHNN